jgi:rubrerythrin
VNESTRQILEILKKAVQAERYFQKEYARGASLAEDPEVRDSFLKLVDDEMEHERILLERYHRMKGEPLDISFEEE